ncbi:hypothetical protein A3K63_01100 [Candidatus Micrarchaeota archaeon RBG_16_49_10]|nr:MAG: hypothetical protein A3K63_01100 [Candidatus Micrarchaeota archaeon RBG_16_49_10]
MGALKLLIGVLLLVVPLGLYAYELMGGEIGLGVYMWKSLGTVIQGTLPPFIMLIGLFIVWLELDEWKIEKELKAEEEKEKEVKQARPVRAAKKAPAKKAAKKKK